MKGDRTFLAALLLVGAAQVAAAAGRPVAIRAGQILDGTGREPIRNGGGVVRGSHIESVGPAASVQVPGDAETIDLAGETLLPGLIDTHGRLNSRYGTTPIPGVEGLAAQSRDPDGKQMLRTLRNTRVSLLCGVTTIRMTGEAGWNDVHLSYAIRAGVVPGPRIVLGGLGLTPTAGHWHGSDNRADGPWEIVRQVREHFHQGAEWLKIAVIDRRPEGTVYTAEAHPRWVQALGDLIAREPLCSQGPPRSPPL